MFSEILRKMFRTQVSYFDDIDYSETVDYLVPDPPTEEEIKDTLTEYSISGI